MGVFPWARYPCSRCVCKAVEAFYNEVEAFTKQIEAAKTGHLKRAPPCKVHLGARSTCERFIEDFSGHAPEGPCSWCGEKVHTTYRAAYVGA